MSSLNEEITKAYNAFDGLTIKEMSQNTNVFPDSKKILKMLFYARQNYIRYFSFSSSNPLDKDVDDANILLMHSDYKDFSLNNFPGNHYLEYLKKKIKEIYKYPDYLAKAIQHYFIKFYDSDGKEISDPFKSERDEYINQEKLSIFANVIIPSIYGYFIEETQASFGFDFICFLFMFNYDFSKPFFLSYMMSATTFLDIFWTNFFNKITIERYSPSLFQLKEIFWLSLKSSIQFFSGYHIQLLKNCLLRNYDSFFDLLFTQFLFPSFPTYNQLSLISQQKIDILYEYIRDQDEDFPVEIQELFHHYNFVDSQQVQFLNDNLVVILSQHEAKLFSELLQDYDKSNSVSPIFSERINNYSPCYFDIAFDDDDDIIPSEVFKKGPAMRIFNDVLSTNSDSHKDQNGNELSHKSNDGSKIPNDVRITYALLKIDCHESRINPLSVINDIEGNCQDDTFEIKQLKNKYKKYQNLHSLQVNSLELMREDLIHQKKDFVSLLLQQQRIKCVDIINTRIQKRHFLLEEDFYSRFQTGSKQSQALSIRLIKYIPDVFNPFLEYRASFIQLIQDSFNVMKYNEYFLKNQQFFQKVVMNVSFLDSTDVPNRLLILESNILSVDSICSIIYKEYVNPIFIKCFSKGALRTLYETFVFTYLYKKQNRENFKIISSQIPNVIILFKFILDRMNNHLSSNPDDQDIQNIVKNLT